MISRLSAFALLALALLTGCAGRGGDSFGDQDKAELVRLSLERALEAEEIPDHALLVEQGNPIVISTENIDPDALPELSGFELLPLMPEEIQTKANAEGDFLRLRFQPFEVQSPDEVIIRLDNTWVAAEDSTNVYLSGGGFEIRYQRQEDGWAGEVTSVWIS
ncbi:MAG: hypothetical protein ACRDHL_12900 [Candidatus Promineifilaceae bacterium]